MKEELLKEYRYKIELHSHSRPASGCCSCGNERFIELYAERKVDVICLTNHFLKDMPIFVGKDKKECIDAYLSDYEHIKELAEPYGIEVVLGCEIRFPENTNDYLIYGVDRSVLEESYDYLNFSMEHYRENVKLPNSIFVQAHPFRDNITVVDPKYVDGMETLNFCPHHNSRNSSSANFAKDNNIDICVGGSDFHDDIKYYAGAILMLSKTKPKDSFELARILKSKDYIFLLGDNHIIIP